MLSLHEKRLTGDQGLSFFTALEESNEFVVQVMPFRAHQGAGVVDSSVVSEIGNSMVSGAGVSNRSCSSSGNVGSSDDAGAGSGDAGGSSGDAGAGSGSGSGHTDEENSMEEENQFFCLTEITRRKH